MAATNFISRVRLALQTAAQGVAPFLTTSSQVVLGSYNWSAGTNLWKNIITTGPWLFIKPPKGRADGITFNANFTLKMDLIYGFAGNQNHDWQAEDQYVANLVAAWTTYSEFVRGGNLGPFLLEWDEPEVADDQEGIAVVARTPFTLTMPMVADQGNV